MGKGVREGRETGDGGGIQMRKYEGETPQPKYRTPTAPIRSVHDAISPNDLGNVSYQIFKAALRNILGHSLCNWLSKWLTGRPRSGTTGQLNH